MNTTMGTTTGMHTLTHTLTEVGAVAMVMGKAAVATTMDTQASRTHS